MIAAEQFVSRFGDAGGTPVLYFHGAPGAPAEAELFGAALAQHKVSLWAIDRARLATNGAASGHLDQLTDLVVQISGGRRLPMLGFSIGAALALRVAARLQGDAGPLLLVSAGGPLDVPGAFDAMGAGAGVFKSAQADGAGFALAVRVQALLARRAPLLLQRLLFAGTGPADRAFAASAAGRAALAAILGQAWAGSGKGYRNDIRAYVEPWSNELDRILVQVTLWHGLDDRWAPIAMARNLANRLTNGQLNECRGGHYTTLVNQAAAALAAAA